MAMLFAIVLVHRAIKPNYSAFASLSVYSSLAVRYSSGAVVRQRVACSMRRLAEGKKANWNAGWRPLGRALNRPLKMLSRFSSIISIAHFSCFDARSLTLFA